MNNKKRNVRIQFEISDRLNSRIESLKDDCDIATHTDFYKNMVSLFEWASTRVREGYVIAALDPKTKNYRELTLPAFESLRLAPRESVGSLLDDGDSGADDDPNPSDVSGPEINLPLPPR